MYLGLISYYIKDSSEIIYREEATTHWRGIRDKHDGSCYGFALTSLLYFYHKAGLLQKFPFLTAGNDLNNISLSDNSQYCINYFQVVQFGRKARSYRLVHWEDSPRNLLQDLKDMFRKENGDGRTLSFINNYGSGSHSVTPYKLKRNSLNSGFDLMVYDSNHPNDNSKYILIDSLTDRWTDFTGLGYGSGGTGCFLRLESSEFLLQQTIPNSPSQNALLKSAQGSSNMTIYNTTNADIIISSSSGNQIGFKDSVSFGNIPGGVPIIPMNGGYHPPIGYNLPNDTY